MPVFFNNCRCRDHVGLFGAAAFHDLNTTGGQAEMATNLKPGEECIVAAYDDGAVVFRWFSFSRETLMPDPDEPGTRVRVFFGKMIKSERLSKADAAKTDPYSVFFNIVGNFKRPSVIKPKVARRMPGEPPAV
jgi:hypothetical protein